MAELYALIYQGTSKIGTLIPDCVVEEVYEDRALITSHPVERGSNISDHAYILPKQLEMRIAWADYKTDSTRGEFGGDQDRSKRKYEELLVLQAKLEPLNVSTGKRSHRDMLIEAISVTHDEKTKHAVIAIVRMREVRFAESILNITTSPTRLGAPQSTQDRISVGPVQGQVQQTDQESPNSPPDANPVILPPLVPAPAEILL